MRNPPFWKVSKNAYPEVGEAIGKLHSPTVNFSVVIVIVVICKGHAVASVKSTVSVIELRESVISAFSVGFFPSS